MVPTLCARTIGAADGVGVGVDVGVGVADGEGDAVAAEPEVVLPHAASSSTEDAPTAAIRKKCTKGITANRYTVKTSTWPFSTFTCSEGNGESGLE
jgi:hypothetical protein